MVGMKINFKPIDFARANKLGYSSTALNNGNRLVAISNTKKNYTHLWELNPEGNIVSASAATKGPRIVKQLKQYHDKIDIDKRNELYFTVANSFKNLFK